MSAHSTYAVVIGLEVHVQLLTRTKLFCGCSTDFGLPPNSATCPVCTGLPGALPVMNRHAFEHALKAALALNCEVRPFTKWDRKNYFYPDLPKSYQISQYDLPVSHNGWLEFETTSGVKRVGIIRAHLEEDAGKMLHDDRARGDTLIDLNRAGTPLLEIVTRPDLASPEDARAFLEELRLLLREIKVSDCEMQEGSLRCDANINLRVARADGSQADTPIVEVKNLNSLRAVERAMRYEAERQHREFQATGRTRDEAAKTTSGWDENRGITVVQRRKEEASDYRYFPDPDLVPVAINAAWVDAARKALGELPATLRQRLQTEYGLSAYDAGVLTRQGRAFARFFEEVASRSGDPKAASNWLSNRVLETLNDRKVGLDDLPLSAQALAELIRETRASQLNPQRSREVYARMLQSGASARQVIEELGFRGISDEHELRELIRRAIAANPKAAEDYRKGKIKAADAIKGAVMRQTKGLAKADLLQRLLAEELKLP
jgi:aspartyl-tRNA(Asn)/glutamyl-tRNA(Gln) amidotransferase subunit B